MKQPTQNDLVLRHLVRYGSITDAVARDKYGITRLAARIHDLRYTYGAHIGGQSKQFKTRLGRIGRYEEYRMPGGSRIFWRNSLKGGK